MNFKGWLRGMHHYVGDLQDYINEYTYRFNRSFMKGNIAVNVYSEKAKWLNLIDINKTEIISKQSSLKRMSE